MLNDLYKKLAARKGRQQTLMPGSKQDSSDSPPRLEELLSLNKAAERCGVSASHLRLLVREGEVWGMKLGRNWVTTEKAVREYLARDHRPGPKTQ